MANVFASGVFRLGGAQDAAPASYEKHNPVNFASWWKTPVLAPHGEMDFRIPATQGLSTFAALQRREIESRRVIFPGENHHILRPANGLLWQRNVLNWLNPYLKPGGRRILWREPR